MSIANSRCAPNEPLPEVPDLLRRINALLAAGGDVLLFRQSELYNMKALVSRYTQAHVRFAVDLSLMIQAFEGIYGNLEGRLLEALARLLAQNVHIYVYPMGSVELRERVRLLSASPRSAQSASLLPDCAKRFGQSDVTVCSNQG